MTTPGAERCRLLASGRVQGVCYRAGCREAAQALGLTGWVRNLGDGRVEAVAEGPRGLLEELAAWCRRGPSAARVREVQVSWGEATGEFVSFEVRGW
ncbi:MAG: acylphosphatase [Planctomycetes bacterium]|nr:acylphosphatase [Planctomycetota bacterium]